MFPSLTEDRSHPNHWFNRAADLRSGAAAVWYSMRIPSDELNQELGLPHGNSLSAACWPVYHMLCGLAIEVILKAVICQHKTVPESHDLIHLARVAEISISENEKRLMGYYQRAVVWAGRYPVPKDCTDQKLHEFYDYANSVLCKPAGKLGALTLYRPSGAADWENFHRLWRRLAEHFKQ